MPFSLVFAAGDGPNPMNPEPWVAGTAVVVWLIALVILVLKVWPVITKGLDERNDKILGEIKAAEDARSQAKQALAEYEKSLADAREEANRTITEARVEAQRVADEMKAANERDLAERMARAKSDIEAARKSAVAEIHDQASELAAAVAAKILQREINASDQARLVEESIRELDAAGV
jgi:F-type H+-transporting ATPase subunit b